MRVIDLDSGETLQAGDDEDLVIGMEGFGAPVPMRGLFPHFGFTPRHVADRALALSRESQ